MFKRFKTIRTGGVLFLACLFLFSCARQPTPGVPDTDGSVDSSPVTAAETVPTTEELKVYYRSVQTLYEKVALDGWGLKGVKVTEFPYFEKALAGEIDLSKPKLTFEDVERLKKQYDNVQDVLKEIDRIQPDCDVRFFPTQDWRYYFPNYAFEKGMIVIPIDTIRSSEGICVYRTLEEYPEGFISAYRALQDLS